MTKFLKLIGLPLVAMILILSIGGCDSASSSGAASPDVQGAEAEIDEDYARGPNGGRLLEDGAFALEMTIFETGVDPQYRIYPYQDGEPIDLGEEDGEPGDLCDIGEEDGDLGEDDPELGEPGGETSSDDDDDDAVDSNTHRGNLLRLNVFGT